VSAPDRFPARIDMRLLSEEPMMYVCRSDHHLARRDHVSITELAAEEMIGFPAEFGLRRLVEDAFTATGIASQTPYEVAAAYPIAADLVRNGLGTIFMPASETRRFPDLRAVTVRPALGWTIYLASAGDRDIGPASTKLAEMLFALAGTTTTSLRG
jgi:DNA-binding transcriptional LysR family regulator